MDKISTQTAIRLNLFSGLSPHIDRQYEDERVKEIAIDMDYHQSNITRLQTELKDMDEKYYEKLLQGK